MPTLNRDGMSKVIEFVNNRLQPGQKIDAWYAQMEHSEGHMEAGAQYTLSGRPEVLMLGREYFVSEDDYPKLTQDMLDAIAMHMDDAILEELHSTMSPCTPGEFLTAYLSKDPEFPIYQFQTK